MKTALTLLVLSLAACSGSCGGTELPQRSGAAVGRTAPLMHERAPTVDAQLPHPVCEASALLMLSDHTWLVGDNEVHDQLFGFTRAFDEATPFEMPGGNRPRDIEALARTGEREFLVVGSHSNKRDGSVSGKRHRLRWLRFVSHEGGAEEIHFSDNAESRWGESPELCQTELFEDAAVAANRELVERFCRALLSAGEMDIEGAATLDGHVWLGFRRPVVDGQAVMVRLSGYRLRFDDIEVLDLGGRGIRGMDDHDEQLYVIGGPSEDSDVPHMLYAAVAGQAHELVSLPASAEGLAVHSPGHALVVMDGAEGTITCDEPSRVKAVTFSLPALLDPSEPEASSPSPSE